MHIHGWGGKRREADSLLIRKITAPLEDMVSDKIFLR
jgi:hypothetical protein